MSYRGYQSTPGGDQQNEYSRFSQGVAANVQKISQNGIYIIVVFIIKKKIKIIYIFTHFLVNQMQRMVNQLGTAQDSENLRSQLYASIYELPSNF